MNKEEEKHIKGKVSRVGFLDANKSLGLQFMVENNNKIFILKARGMFDNIFLTKSGDNVSFTSEIYFLDNRYNVNRESFVNITLVKDLT